jgi:hypothetical protein
MLANDQTAPRPVDEQSVLLNSPWGVSPSGPLDVRAPEGDLRAAQDRAALGAMVRDWSAESGLPVPEFQRVYLEQRVGDLLDEHPHLRWHDAERVALLADPWLDDRAA